MRRATVFVLVLCVLALLLTACGARAEKPRDIPEAKKQAETGVPAEQPAEEPPAQEAQETPEESAAPGGAAGSLFASWMHAAGDASKAFGATTYGVTGIPGIPAINNVPMYLIELLIASGIAFTLTWIIWKEDAPAKKDAPAPVEEAPAEPMPSVVRCAAGELLQPCAGKVVAREEIPDETFAAGILGDGVGVVPDSGIVVAPFDGTVTSVFDTKHAITLEKDGMEVLIHIGVNTVNMQGEGFTAFVEEGAEVKAGQKLLGFDREAIAKAGYNDTVVMLLTNSDDLEGVECGLK